GSHGGDHEGAEGQDDRDDGSLRRSHDVVPSVDGQVSVGRTRSRPGSRIRQGLPIRGRWGRDGNFPDAGGPAMTVRPVSDRNTVPLGVAVLGALVVGTGWLLFEGLSFLVGCA